MKCPKAAVCGGCMGDASAHIAKRREKEERLRTLLAEAGVKGDVIRPVVVPGDPLHYRNKVVRSFSVGKTDKTDKTGKGSSRGLISGIYRAETRQTVDLGDVVCHIENEGAGRILATVAALAQRMHISVYDEKTGRGVLRHAMVRVATSSVHKKDGGGEETKTEYLLVLVTGASQFPGRANFLSALRSAHPELTTVVQNVNPMRTGMVLGDPARTGIPDRVLFGPGTVRDTLQAGGTTLSFRISPHSFYQVNKRGAEYIYSTAIAFASLCGGEEVLDAYCGTGTIGLLASGHAGHVTGVESNGDAVRDAIANAKHNGVTNVRFVRGDAGTFLTDSVRMGRLPRVVFMDPPRSGSDEAFLSSLLAAGPERVVYISCNPETLARDLRVLAKGYRVEAVQPVDMFSGTEHLESVCSLRRTN